MDDRTVIGRASAILEHVVESATPVTLAALTRTTGLPKATVRRIADDLVARGFLSRTEGYGVGWRVRALTAPAARAGAGRVATPHLVELVARTPGCAVFLVDATDLDGAYVASELYDRSVGAGWATAGFSPALGAPESLLFPFARLALAHDPARVESLLSQGVPRLTPFTPTTARVAELVRRDDERGTAQESEQVQLGWACVAVRVPDADLRLVLGITGRTSSAAFRNGQAMALAERTADALAADLAERRNASAG